MTGLNKLDSLREAANALDEAREAVFLAEQTLRDARAEAERRQKLFQLALDDANAVTVD